jgi:MFS family permease
MTSIGAVLGGLLLGVLPYPYNFAACFAIAALAMGISYLFLAQTREQKRSVTQSEPANWQTFRREAWAVLRNDGNFRWFILARVLSQFARMALAFYTIYATRTYDMPPEVAGIMTGILSLTQMFASPIVGWLGDQFGNRLVLAGGTLLMVISVMLAMFAPSLEWFYFVFALVGLTNAVQWTSMLAITVEFGTDENRAYYIGLSNTLIAPATLIAPLIGGWLADSVGFASAFHVSIVGGILSIIVLLLFVRNPVARKRAIPKRAG